MTTRRPIDRRTWLKLGGLSLGALATGADPTLGQLLASDSTSRRVSKDFSVILFWANGGPSHLDLFDLKPDAPAEIRGPLRPIHTNVAGLDLCERFPLLAKRADRFALIRSLHHNRGEHSGGTNRFLTGYSSIKANLKDSEFPDVGSVVAERLQDQARDVPLFVANTKAYGSGPAYLGPACSPFMPSPNALTSTGANTYDPVPLYPTAETPSNLKLEGDGTLSLRSRQGLLHDLDTLPRRLEQPETLSAFDEYQQRAVAILTGTRTRAAFDLSREPAEVIARYGDTHWGKSLLTCRRLVEAGVRFVQCQANFRLRPETGRTTTWDDHSVNCDIFKAHDERLPVLDRAMSALVDDLYGRGLDRHVLFLFCGEFGRTPKIAYQDASRRPGRDHWPRAMSVFLAGGGLKMGQVVGSTNARAEEPRERAMNSNCLLATIYHRFGIDPTHLYHDRTGRPIPILAEGEPIEELL